MKVLWLINYPLAAIAEQINTGKTVKEGWVESLYRTLNGEKAQIVVAFPLNSENELHGVAEASYGAVEYYSFYENTSSPEIYDPMLEHRLKRIYDEVNPDIVHCFGAEFPHTLAMGRVVNNPQKMLIGLQGICTEIAKAYNADLPDYVLKHPSFRDIIKRDSLIDQGKKFIKHGEIEREAIKLAGFVAGRTAFDKNFALKVNPKVNYVHLGESLRPVFYEGEWDRSKAVPGRIFVSQGDYPLKGLHYLIPVIGELKKDYPDLHIRIAGNSIIKYESIKDKIKIGGYGKYLRNLIKKAGLENCVVYTGYLDENGMKKEYMECQLFVSLSSCENSPNSLGEAMLLGVPCVATMVGGVPSIFDENADGRGVNLPNWSISGELTAANAGENSKNANASNNTCNYLSESIKNVKNAVKWAFEQKDEMDARRKNARNHAKCTHDREANCRKLSEIYEDMLRIQLH